MNRLFLVVRWAFLAYFSLLTCDARAEERPNIVLDLVDDMGWSNIGCFGGAVETDNVHQLAEHGIRFNHFYNSARCCPTWATLMTGLHPHQVGCRHMALPICERQLSMQGQHRAYHALTSDPRADIPHAYRGWLDETVATLPETLKSAGTKNQASHQILKQPGYVPDIVDTCSDVAPYDEPDAATDRLSREGVSLLKPLQGIVGPIHEAPICTEHEGHRAVRSGRWKMVANSNRLWQLFDIEHDMSESHDIAAERPDVVADLEKAYGEWAQRVGVVPWKQAKAYSVYNRSKLKLKFQDNFENGIDRWEILDPKTWNLRERNDNHSLEITARDSDYEPAVRSPTHVALIKEMDVGDFELVFRVRSTKDTGDHRDCCVFFGYQDDRHFYYTHLGAKPDLVSGQILIVNGAPRAPLTKNERLTPWDDQWHKVKVVRRLLDGTIKVFFDDMQTPHMSVEDRTFGTGRIGIGSFDDLNEFDDIQLLTD